MTKLLAVALAVAVACAAVALALPSNHFKFDLSRAAARKLRDFNSPTYFFGAGGSTVTVPNGTRLATIYDLQSAEFREFFNTNQGLGADSSTSMNGCCVVIVGAVTTGLPVYLTIRGSLSDPMNYSYIAPYSNGGAHECASTLPPTNNMLGCIEGDGYCPGMFFGPLTQSIVSRFAERVKLDSAVGCPGTTTGFAIYRAIPARPTFLAGSTGNGMQPPSGYKLATLDDLKTSEFLNEINNNRVKYDKQVMAGCCVIAIQGGFWTVTDGSFWSIYTQEGTFDCSESPSSPIKLGFAAGAGGSASQFVPTLTQAWVAKYQLATTFSPQLGCGAPSGQNTFAIYKLA